MLAALLHYLAKSLLFSNTTSKQNLTLIPFPIYLICYFIPPSYLASAIIQTINNNFALRFLWQPVQEVRQSSDQDAQFANSCKRKKLEQPTPSISSGCGYSRDVGNRMFSSNINDIKLQLKSSNKNKRYSKGTVTGCVSLQFSLSCGRKC